MEHQFISKQNVRNLYNFINSVVQKNENVDLDRDKKYKKIVKKLAHSLLRHEDNNNKSVQELNKLAVSKIGEFIVDTIKKKKGINTESNNKSSSNIKPLENDNEDHTFSNISSYTEEADISLDDLYNNSIISGKVDSVEATISQTDFKSKLDALQANRGYDEFVKNTNRFREEVNKAESMQKDQLRVENARRSGNEFFDQLNHFGDAQADEDSYNGLELAYNTKSSNEIIRTSNKNSSNSNVNSSSSKHTKPKDNSEVVGLPNEFYFKSSDTDNLIKNITIKNRDFSRNNEIEEYDPKIAPNLIQPIGEAAAIQPLLYENTQTGMERITKRMMIIDTGNSSSSLVTNLGTTNNYWYKFRVDLEETLNLDKLTDIYLESLTIYGQTSADHSMYFVIDVDKFNIQTYSNNVNLRNKFVVPNNSELDLVDSGLTYASINGDVITVSSSATANQYLNENDNLYTRRGEFIGAVSSMSSDEITLRSSINSNITSLIASESLYIGRSRNHVNKCELSSNYVCTINPSRLTTLEFTITDENNKSVEDGDNYVFQDQGATTNRIIMEFLLISRTSVADFI